jgi:ADP-heptose:LPS heptosyltransferase
MSWRDCKKILVIRPDNMGDLIMSAPAIRALKETFNATITVLTSSMAKAVIKHIPEIDNDIIFDLPWVKTESKPDKAVFNDVVEQIKGQNFDAAVIFTVFSQNPLPTAMLAYLAGIPRILAYCRENPYHLITDWVPDKEPYDEIKHQVRRDLDLVASVGAHTRNEDLYLTSDKGLWPGIAHKLTINGLNLNEPWMILHPGVSEMKREFPADRWAEAGKRLIADVGCQLLITGALTEKGLTDELAKLIGQGSVSAGGLFDLDEYICLVKHAPLLLSVNTGTVHIASAVGTKVVVLYAQTNPQHTPWNVPCKVLEFPVPYAMHSRNEVIAFVNNTVYSNPAAMPTADNIVAAVSNLLSLPSGQPSPGRPSESPVILTS